MLDKIQFYQNEFLLRFNHLSENKKVPAIEAFVETLTPLITAAEKRHSREAIIQSLSMIRNEIRLGPLVQQSQDWIKGYQGDFETIRYVLQNDNQAPPGTLAYRGNVVKGRCLPATPQQVKAAGIIDKGNNCN